MSIGVSDLDDFVITSSRHTVETLMRFLSPPVYHQYRSDMVIFLEFGKMCVKHNQETAPSSTQLQQWIPQLVKQLRYASSLQVYHVAEKLAKSTIQDTPLLSVARNDPSKGGYDDDEDEESYEEEVIQDEDQEGEYKNGTNPTSPTSKHSSSSPRQSGIDNSARNGRRKEGALLRGQNYPAFEGEALARGVHHDGLTTPHTSYSIGLQYIRSHLPEKIQWDGTTKGFQEYKYAIEGFYTQCNSSYLFDERFHKLYVKYGPSVVIDHPDLPRYINITRPQLDEAKTHLYGAIQQSTRTSNTVRKFINKHRDERDGIMVWIDLSATQDNDGNSEVREATLIAITSQIFTKNYPGGFVQYLDDIEDAYSGLDVLGNIFSTRQKMQTLLNNLQLADVNDYLVSHCRDFFSTFEECVSYLRKEAVRRNHVNGVIGSRNTRLSRNEDQPTKQDGKSLNDVLAFCEENDIEVNAHNLRAINMAMQRNPEFYMSKTIFDILKKLLSTEQLKAILDERDKAEKNAKVESAKRPKENTPPVVPRQYQNAKSNHVAVQVEDDSDDDSMPSEEEQNRFLAKLAVLTSYYDPKTGMLVQREA